MFNVNAVVQKIEVFCRVRNYRTVLNTTGKRTKTQNYLDVDWLAVYDRYTDKCYYINKALLDSTTIFYFKNRRY